MKRLICPLLICLLSGCTLFFPHRPDCEEITALHSLVERRVSQDELIVHVTERYGIASDDILVEEREGAKIIRWEKSPANYVAFIEEGVMHHVNIIGIRWTLDQLVSCLGAPEAYRAEYQYSAGGRTELSISVLLPDQGIEAYGYEFHRPPAKRSHTEPRGSFPIYVIGIGLPAKPEEMLRSIYGRNEELYAQILQEYKPWPGEIGVLEIIIDPDVQEYWDWVGDESEADPGR